MALGDSNRTGPNQDINDPTTLIEVGYEFNRISENLGNMLAKSDAQDPDAVGEKIIDINIPLKISDGTIFNFDCENINKVGEDFEYDADTWSSAVINTYIDLAEIFREYWNTLNAVLDDLNNTDIFDVSDIDPSPSGASGSLGGRLYTEIISSFTPSQSFDEPVWSGVGPNLYNYETYPQLLTEVLKLETTLNELFNTEVNEQYYYYKTSSYQSTPDFITPGLDDVSFSTASFLSLRNVLPFASQLVLQIPNFGTDVLTINYELSTSYSRSSSAAPGFGILDQEGSSSQIVVKIGDYNLYNSAVTIIDDTDSDFNIFPLPQTASLSSSLTDSFDIPVGKSAFIEINVFSFCNLVLRSDYITSFSSSESIRVFYNLDDKTISNSFSASYP